MILGEIFQYLVVFLLAIWTARLAIAKGRNAWGWGGAALVLGLLPWHLFGVLPVLILLFMKLPNKPPAEQVDRLTCARCAKSYSNGQHFCTGCGWDLDEAYAPEESDEGQPFPAGPQVQTTVQSTGIAQPIETAEASAAELTPTEPSKMEAPLSETVAPSEATPPDVGAPQEESADSAGDAGETEANTAEEDPTKAYVPWGTYDVGVAPTAVLMTSRGMERFEEGKFQEAIDQFTKAIALDPNHAEAWQRRAEAYAQLGRPKQAEDDRRHLQGLDPSSSPG